MSLGVVALFFAAAAAVWILARAAGGAPAGGDGRNVAILKGVIWLGLAAALFAVRLWPLAFMILIAAGGVTAIEIWRDRAIKSGEDAGAGAQPPAPRVLMDAEEAAAVLGVGLDASPAEIRAAHKKLISQLHPDKGGSDYLAAKINDARDALLQGLEQVDVKNRNG